MVAALLRVLKGRRLGLSVLFFFNGWLKNERSHKACWLLTVSFFFFFFGVCVVVWVRLNEECVGRCCFFRFWEFSS